MKLFIAFIFSFLIPQCIFPQLNEDTILLTIGKQNISVPEFERNFNKNNNIHSFEKQTIDEYLEMFINFKLKVQAAIDAGLDTISSFKNELKGYRNQLARSYLTDNSVIDSLIWEAYMRMHTEVNASHIMVALQSTKDTLDAWNKIIAIRQKLIKGENFENLAVELSEDPSAKVNKGNLGYFTVFQMVYPFESAAYNSKMGEISQPVRSNFGYHLIKTNDKRPARGEVKVAHIMMVVPQGSSDSVWISAENKIKDIAKQLKSGADFSKLAMLKSEDRGSAKKGGELAPFGTGRMIHEFEEVAFNLKYPGDISDPVKTPFGWHILKLIEKTGIPEFDLVKQDIKSKIARDERAELGTNSLIAKLKKQYQFTENLNLLNEFYSKTQFSIPKSYSKNIEDLKAGKAAESSENINLKFNSSKEQLELFKFNNISYKLGDFTRYLKNLPAPDSTLSPELFVQSAYTSFVKSVLLDYENKNLENKYPEFKDLMEEYHDGILLFNLSDSIVWSKAQKDTIGLVAFFENNRANYQWPKRVEATIVNCKSTEIADKAISLAKKLKSSDKIRKEMLNGLCDTSSEDPCIILSYNKFIKGENHLIDSITWKKGVSQVFKNGSSSTFVVVHNLLKTSPKLLSECRGQVISDFQNALDLNWVTILHKKYSVTINTKILNQLKNKYAGKYYF